MSEALPRHGSLSRSENTNPSPHMIEEKHDGTITSGLEPDYFQSLAQPNDMLDLYKQAGGLGTAAGRKLFALYNRDHSNEKIRQVSSFYIRTANPQNKTAPSDPHQHHLEQQRRKNYEILMNKTKYQPPKPQAPSRPMPSRNALMLAAIPKRKSQAVIEREMKADLELATAPKAPAKSFIPSREAAITKLQAQMEHGDELEKTAKEMGVDPSTVKKPSLRAQLQRKYEPAEPVRQTRSEEDELFDKVMTEVRERETFLRRLKAIRGDRPRTKKEEEDERRVAQEIQDRMKELHQIHGMMTT